MKVNQTGLSNYAQSFDSFIVMLILSAGKRTFYLLETKSAQVSLKLTLAP